jgi:hypothetical protein
MFQNYKKYADYFPIALITLFFIAEAELEAHAVNISCQFCMTIISIVIFYIICFNFTNAKNIAFITAVIIWIILLYVKRNFIKY